MSHLQYTAKSHYLQWNIKQLSKICHRLYQDYCPILLKYRHAELGIKSQRHFIESAIFSLMEDYWKEAVLTDGQSNSYGDLIMFIRG